ncbi:OR2H1-containing, partial [Ictidomys tridecemlineatus]|uniref:G-protein coupled receptors family 1 profile domain-containing protein n=1 Tax=Ictidomys tridecemlineatus TaxID=43179 RepID=A0A287CS78_ICTTR
MPLGTTECILLTVMAFDHYMAVCQPLHYATIIHSCWSVAWVLGLAQSIVQTPPTLLMTFLYTTYNEIQLAMSRVIFVVVPLSLNLVSYTAIAREVLRINFAQAWKRALGTFIAVYLQPKNRYAQ